MLLTATSFALNTTVARESGTILVFGLSKNKIVVAADSRGKGDSGGYSDHQCKIIALSDKFVFASNGMADLSIENVAHPAKRNVIMEANKEAEIAFKSVRPGSDDFLRKVALLWGRHVSRILEQKIKVFGPKAVLGPGDDNPIINGYFFGVSPKGGLALYMENIFRVGNDVSFDSEPKAIPLTDTIQYALRGKAELAQKEKAQWERQSATLLEADRDVLKVVLWVRLTLEAHPDSNEVGGPIDSLTITPLTGVRWHSLKDECRTQN